MTTDFIGILQQAQQRAAAARPKVNGFPHYAETLRIAGITAIETSIATGGTVYHLSGGAVAESFGPIVEFAEVVPAWDEASLVAAIRADQAGRTSFPEFLRSSWNAGVIHFRVGLNERTCTYFGTASNHYVEKYPAVTPGCEPVL
jgi:uncharacterized protein YbcV (DUF1398 family)